MTGEESALRRVAATVIEQLPNAKWRVRLPSGETAVAHAGSAVTVNSLRFRPNDRVLVALSEHDPGRGRIEKRLSEGEAAEGARPADDKD